MAAKPSMTGITPENWRTRDRDPATRGDRYVGSAEAEAARNLSQRRQGIAVPVTPANPSALLNSAKGTKVAGSTTLKGGAL